MNIIDDTTFTFTRWVFIIDRIYANLPKFSKLRALLIHLAIPHFFLDKPGTELTVGEQSVTDFLKDGVELGHVVVRIYKRHNFSTH